MDFNLLDENSIILQIGNIKLSDTDETFGKNRTVNGYEYNPLLNPNKMFGLRKQMADNIAYGDYRCGVSISNDSKDSIILAYGANRINSNAQSMAIGHHDGSQYFFVVETFRNIYAERIGEKPELASRRIVVCESLWKHDEKQKVIIYDEEIYKTPTKREEDCFRELMEKLKRLEPAFEEENLKALNALRKRREQDSNSHDSSSHDER